MRRDPAELRRFGAVAAMVAGGLLGALLLRHAGRPELPLLIVAVSVFAMSIAYAFTPRHRPPPEACARRETAA